MKRFFKFASLLLVFCMIMSFVGCQKEEPKKEISVPDLFQSILKQVAFADTLESAGAASAMYFPDLPEGVSVELYIGSGYFADEVALLTLTNAGDMAAAKASVEAHLKQMNDQFANYIPEELGKIKNAIVWDHGNYILVCITDATADVRALIDHAGDPAFTLPGNTAPTKPTEPTEPTTEPTTIPTVPPTEPPTEPTEPPTEPTEPPTEPTEPPTEPTEPTEPPVVYPPDLPVNPVQGLRPDGYPSLESLSGQYHYMSGMLRVDNRAFEFWAYRDQVASNYASLVSQVADALAGTTRVYSLMIPTSFGIMVPDDIQKIYPNFPDQNQGIETILGKMSDNVIPVRCFDNLMSHRNEYLYFRTDHHWNGIGAYYAYEAFCETKGIQPYTMAQRQQMVFPNFLGSLYRNSGKDANLLPGDTVYAYKPYFTDATMVYYDANGNMHHCPIVDDATYWDPYYKYLAFSGADQPLGVLTNPNVTDGSVCIVVKESYGNAMMSYFVDHYSTVYEVDYRYWKGNLADFAREVGADDLIFANNMNMVVADVLVAKLYNIVN